MTKEESMKAVGEKMQGMRSCLFITHGEGGALVGRPMATQDVEFSGSVWFMTDKRSQKVAQIKDDSHVALSYAHSNGVRFIFLSGTATLKEDRAKIHEFWNDFYKAWFNGEDDPNITLIEVKATRAEYWDNKGGTVGALADIAIGAVTGETNTLDEHEVVTF